MEVDIDRSGVRTQLKREYETGGDINDDSHSKRHRSIQPGESSRRSDASLAADHLDSAGNDTKNSPGPVSTDQHSYAALSFHPEDLRTPSSVASQQSYAGSPDSPGSPASSPNSSIDPNDHPRLPAPPAPVWANHPASVAFPSFGPLGSTPGSSIFHQSHGPADGLQADGWQADGSQDYQPYRHQHQIQQLVPGTHPYVNQSQQFPLQGPLPSIHHVAAPYPDVNPTLGQNGGLGSDRFEGSSHANPASSHGSERSPTYTESFPFNPYSQTPGGGSLLPNPQVQRTYGWVSTSNGTGPFDGVSESVPNRIIASQPRNPAVFDIGFDNVGTSPFLVHQGQIPLYPNTPHNPALLGGGELWSSQTSSSAPEGAGSSGTTFEPQQNHAPDQQRNISTHSRAVIPTNLPLARLNTTSDLTENSSAREDGSSTARTRSARRRAKRAARSSPSTRASPPSATRSRRQRALADTAQAAIRSRPLSEQERLDAATTREINSCLRCKFQKQKCELVDGDSSSPCLSCRDMDEGSKKVTHRLPCVRFRLMNITLYRGGGLGLTRRWADTRVKNVDSVVREDFRTVLLSQGFCKTDLEFDVVRFEPQAGDVTARVWITFSGDRAIPKSWELAPYCFKDIYRAAEYLETYSKKNALLALVDYYQESLDPITGSRRPQNVIQKTYQMAVRRYEQLKTDLDSNGDLDSQGDFHALSQERTLLGHLFMLWFAIRHTTGSLWIKGDEKLGMEPMIEDQSYPMFGKVAIPRMMVAQFDSINHALLAKHRKGVINNLEALMKKADPRPWLTIYLTLFILLHESSLVCQDRFRHARENYGSKPRYSVPQFVEGLQEGCNNMLWYWRYYNNKPWPSPSNPQMRHETHLRDLNNEDYNVVMETLMDPEIQNQLDVWRHARAENGFVEVKSDEADSKYDGPQIKYDWDHPYYWIAQLFDEDWTAQPTYQRERVPRVHT